MLSLGGSRETLGKPTVVARVSTQSHRAMASSALLSILHLERGIVPRTQAQALSDRACGAKRTQRWNALPSAGPRDTQGEDALTPAAAAGASAGAGRRSYAGCGRGSGLCSAQVMSCSGRRNGSVLACSPGVPGLSVQCERGLKL